jgi:hypothetical protein
MRLLILLLAVGLCACNDAKVAQLEKENKELRKQVDDAKHVDLATQAKCSEAAKQFFRENWLPRDSATILLEYTNHFNISLGKCFISVEWHYNEAGSRNGGWFNTFQLSDVYENAKYAHMSEHHWATYGANPETHVDVVDCVVTGDKCSSKDDYFTKTRTLIID